MCRNHLCFALEESGALFTGDHIMGWSTSVVILPDGDMGDYMKSLEKLYAREDRVFTLRMAKRSEKAAPDWCAAMIGHRRQREEPDRPDC